MRVECFYCEPDKDGRHEEHCIFYNPIKVVEIPSGKDLPRNRRNPFWDEVTHKRIHRIGHNDE